MEFKEFSFDAIGSKIHVVIPKSLDEETSKQIAHDCYEECMRIDDWYSRFKSHNTLSLLNESIGDWQEVDDEVFYMLEKAKKYETQTNGYFTLSTKEILEYWGYDSKYQLHKAKQIQDTDSEEFFEDEEDEWFTKDSSKSNLIKINSFELDDDEMSVLLKSPIEFGGLGKGYALDCMVEICKSFELEAFMISAGGDMYGFHKDKDKGFQIYMEDPNNKDQHIGMVSLNGFSLASSSSNRRKWDKYHHIVNPKTKKPAQGIVATYIQAQEGIDADSYATALFAMGYEEAKKIAPTIKEIEVLLVSENSQIFKTNNFKCILNTK